MRCEMCDDTRLITVPVELRDVDVKKCPYCDGKSIAADTILPSEITPDPETPFDEAA